jgi:hypothetical protein
MAMYQDLGAARMTDVMTLDQIAELLGVPTWERIYDLNIDHLSDEGHRAYRAAIDEGQSEEEAESTQEAVENESGGELMRTWYGAALRAAEHTFEEHGLILIPSRRDNLRFKIAPEKSWEDAARRIMDTINGVGMFEFADLREFLASGPYTARTAVLSHLGWIKRASEVYGRPSPRRIYEQAWR